MTPTKLTVSAFALAALGGALVMDGCVSHPPKPATASPPGAGGEIHMIDYSNSDGSRSTVLLTGAIGDFGEAVSVYPNGKINSEHTSELRLSLTRGSFRVSIVDLDKRIVAAFRSFHFDTPSCSGNVSVTAPTPIVAGSGTGAYKGLEGNFNLTAMIDEIVPKSTCNPTGASLAQTTIIFGPGTVSFG